MRGPLMLALFMLALGTVLARAGDVYVIDNAAGKTPVAIKKDAFALTAVPAMGEGKPNEGFAYATALELAGTGVQIARGRVEPGGAVATHDGRQQYILYVIGGTGTLGLVDQTGATISEIKYKPDDVIVFQPNTLHNWKNSSAAPFEFLGVDLAPPRK
jgi:quercetin dioxygenase-like cupin family protein